MCLVRNVGSIIRKSAELSHQNLQVSPGLRQTNSCDRCSHPCEHRSSTQYCPGDFDGTALGQVRNILFSIKIFITMQFPN